MAHSRDAATLTNTEVPGSIKVLPVVRNICDVTLDASSLSPRDFFPGALMATFATVELCLEGAAVRGVTADGSVWTMGHRCAPNCLLIQRKLACVEAISAGDPLFVNVSLNFTKLPSCQVAGFACEARCCHSGSDRGMSSDAAPKFTPLDRLPCQRIMQGWSALSPALQATYLPFADTTIREHLGERAPVVCPHDCNATVQWQPGLGHCTVAKDKISSGAVIFECCGTALPFPTIHTICTSSEENTHILFRCDAQCLAHSCAPNCRIEVQSLVSFLVVATRDIFPGETIAFNYLTTEWDMNAPFDCRCAEASGSRQETCFRRIRGFKHLAEDQKCKLLPFCTKAVKHLFETK